MDFGVEEELDYGEDEVVESCALDKYSVKNDIYRSVEDKQANLSKEESEHNKNDGNSFLREGCYGIIKNDTNAQGSDDQYLEINFTEDENEVYKLLDDVDAESSALWEKQNEQGVDKQKNEETTNGKIKCSGPEDSKRKFKSGFKKNTRTKLRSIHGESFNKNFYNSCDKRVSLAENKFGTKIRRPPRQYSTLMKITENRPPQDMQSSDKNFLVRKNLQSFSAAQQCSFFNNTFPHSQFQTNANVSDSTRNNYNRFHKKQVANCHPNISGAVINASVRNSAKRFMYNKNSNFQTKFHEFHCDKYKYKKYDNTLFSSTNLYEMNKILTLREKEKVKLKKEARLQRFLENPIFGEEKSKFVLNKMEVNEKKLCFEDDYIKKIKEQKVRREKVLRLKEKLRLMRNSGNNLGFVPKKPSINKELLLKKKNPFEKNIKEFQTVLGTEIKKEIDWRPETKKELIEPCSESNLLITEEKYRTSSNAFQENNAVLRVVKNENDKNVKFVRTISKTYFELGLTKQKPYILPKGTCTEEKCVFNSSTLMCDEPRPEITKEGFLAKKESQIVGCIVKISNIPQTTTTYDLLELCGLIGKVLEVKLNFPRENSAVIRFANPCSAENFHKTYHKKKLENCILDVIVI